MNSRKTRIHPVRKAAGIFLSLATVMTAYAGFGSMDNSPVSMNVNAAYDYGLTDTCQEGVILHAWQWSFNNIKANMQNIAEAGYTSIQTSVIQQAKESTKGKTNSVWWVYYQPANFTIDDTGNSALGTKAEFKEMCEEAHKYGIHVIVDVVANHLGNQTKYDISTAVPADIRNDKSCWHSTNFNSSDEINYNSRYSITHGSMGGLPDLNTENTKIQTYVINYLKECIDSGADGFRFDAAKHISIDTEGSEYTFWPNVIGAAKSYYKSNGYYDSLYCYGEILGGLSGSATVAAYNKYMSVTDDSTGNTIRGYVNSGNAAGAARPSYDKGVSADNLVLWAESHDTYSGEEQVTTNISASVINKTWALVASRNKASALYFARTNGYRGGNIGTIYSTQCFNKEVAEVNKFHNYFNGQSEYLASSGSIAYNERGTSGVVLVNVSGGSTSVSVTANKMAAGTYKDHVTGNTFTVANGKISGTIGSTGIAVVYDDFEPVLKTTPEDGTSFEGTLDVTLKAENMASQFYSTSEDTAWKGFTKGDKITIGAKTSVGKSVTVNLKGTSIYGTEVTESFTFYKRDPDAKVMVYFENTSYNWNQVYTYIYTPSGTSVIENNAWPGKLMTYNSELQMYEYEVPEALVNGKVIFTESKGATTNRYPAADEPGMALSGASMIFDANYSWTEYHTPVYELTNKSSFADGTNSKTVKVGQKASIALAAEGNVGEVEYQIEYKMTSEDTWGLLYAENGWESVFSEGDVCNITPEYSSIYDVRIIAKDSRGEEDIKYLELKASSTTNDTFVNISDKVETVVPVRNELVVVCDSEGGLGTVQYAAYTRQCTDKETGKWTKSRDYSTDKTVKIKPSSATTYDVLLKAKDSAGNIAEKLLFFKVTANASSDLSNLSAVSDASIPFGSKINVLCASDGGTGVKYAVYCRHTSDSTWSKSQDFSTNTNVSIKPSSATPYYVLIKAKDRAGNIASVTKKVIVTANANSELTNTSNVSSKVVPMGSDITVTCGSSGGSGVTYEVSCKFSSLSTWSTIQAYSSNKTVKIKPSSATPYDIRIRAKDSAGNIASVTIKVTVTANENSTLTNTSTLSVKSASAGDTIKVKCASSGGTGAKTYEISYKLSTDKSYTKLQEYSSNASLSVKLEKAGKYTVYVCVKDASGTVAKKYINITAK